MDPTTLPLIEYGSFGVLIFLIIASVKYFLPKTLEKFEGILKEQRKDFINAIREEREQFSNIISVEHELWSKSMKEIMKSIEKNNNCIQDMSNSLDRLTIAIIYHDATVRGENPQNMGSTSELIDKIRLGNTVRKNNNQKNNSTGN